MGYEAGFMEKRWEGRGKRERRYRKREEREGKEKKGKEKQRFVPRLLHLARSPPSSLPSRCSRT
jgi:hypothetical protein